jgi:hypothetical protein
MYPPDICCRRGVVRVDRVCTVQSLLLSSFTVYFQSHTVIMHNSQSPPSNASSAPRLRLLTDVVEDNAEAAAA